MATRLDFSGEVRKAELTAEGYLRADAIATRTGVFVYRDKEGNTLRELRHPDDVFSPVSLATLGGKPITNNHPSVPVDSTNVKDHGVGVVGDDVIADAPKTEKHGFVRVVLNVQAKDAVDDVRAGRVELSCGYSCDLEAVAGEYEGERYDCRQRNIAYNHLALVDRGRAGPRARIYGLDSADAVQEIPNRKDRQMSTVKIGHRKDSLEVPADVAPMIRSWLKDMEEEVETKAAEGKTLEERVAELEKALATMTSDKKAADEAKMKAEGERDNAKAAAEETAKAAPTADALDKLVSDRVKARSTLLDSARAVLPAEEAVKLDGMSDREIRISAIKAIYPSGPEIKADASEVYVSSRFDGAIDHAKASGRFVAALAAGGTAPAGTRNDGGNVIDAAAARERMRKDHADAWKTPAGK